MSIVGDIQLRNIKTFPIHELQNFSFQFFWTWIRNNNPWASAVMERAIQDLHKIDSSAVGNFPKLTRCAMSIRWNMMEPYIGHSSRSEGPEDDANFQNWIIASDCYSVPRWFYSKLKIHFNGIETKLSLWNMQFVYFIVGIWRKSNVTSVHSVRSMPTNNHLDSMFSIFMKKRILQGKNKVQ